MGVFCARSADATLDSFWPVAGSTRTYVTLVRIVASLAFMLAVLILLGWAFDVTALKSGLPGERATQPLSAVCFALCAVSLGASTERCILCRLLTRGCAIGVLGVAVATIWQNALDVDWGLDQFLFSDAVVHEQPGPYLRAGRPAAGTLVALGLLCCCLLLIRARSQPARTLFTWLATAGALLAATTLLAYLYNLQALYAMGFYAHVGLISALSLSVLFYGVLLRRPDLGWMRPLAESSAGGASARRILVWMGSLLVLLGILVRISQAAVMAGAGIELVLLTMGGFAVFLAALVSHARRFNSLETIRNSVEKDRELALLAHELRNPLTPLRNGIEILRQRSAPDPTLARTTDMMVRQVSQLARLVDELVGTQESTANDPPEPSATFQPPLKILVVDDNADAADSLSMLLLSQGHVVLTASNGRRAVELAGSFRPNVIFMDVAMPELDGIAATRAIRREPWGADMHIVALTAWGLETDRQRTREAGMDGHLVKPVDPQALMVALRRRVRPRQS
jgi:CheY-like chemotaxis protein